MIHLPLDCTYCKNRVIIKGKQGRKKYEIEICGLTEIRIPPPFDERDRWCKNFEQKEARIYE